jgi:hypothetical protein
MTPLLIPLLEPIGESLVPLTLPLCPEAAIRKRIEPTRKFEVRAMDVMSGLGLFGANPALECLTTPEPIRPLKPELGG